MNRSTTMTFAHAPRKPRRFGDAPWRRGLLLAALVSLSACNQNPFMATQPVTAGYPQQTAAALPPNPAQLYDTDRRTSALDANNRDLTSMLAQSRQQVQYLREQLTLVQQQLGETTKRLQESQVAKTEMEKRVQSVETTAARRGGAVITANNSLQQTLRKVDIQGLDVRQEGDVIRIELPTDQLFSPGTAQLVGSAFPLLDRVAGELTRNYPKQLIGIEGHTDSAPAYGNVTNHQLAAAQALAVFDHFTRRNRLPAQQFFLGAQGANKPLTSNATQAGRAKNRRIELVVYPDPIEPQG
jgi:chemotaxis protein MotB